LFSDDSPPHKTRIWNVFVTFVIIVNDEICSIHNGFVVSTLSLSYRNCAAAHALSGLGPEGYHWRVMVEDKAASAGANRTFSWWDIQDGNAKLPVKETSAGDLRKLLYPQKASSSSSSSSSSYGTESATKVAKGAFKMMGKAVASAIGDSDSGSGGVTESHGPPVSVLVVKLLDLVKIHDDAAAKHGSGGSPAPRPPRRAPAAPTRSAAAAPPPQQQQQQQHSRPPPTPARPPVQQQGPPPRQPQQRAQTAPLGNLMDFGDAPAPTARPGGGGGGNPKIFRHAASSSSIDPNETRAERLKREQEARMKNIDRVWDDIDQRWVARDSATPSAPMGLAASFAPSSSSGGNSPDKLPKKKEVGISLDASNAIGKSAEVQQAVLARVNEMEANRQKAVEEARARVENKKQQEDEEDKIRIQLEPKIKAWSEEHGKKKQLRALLASMHTVLWPGTKWTQISIGDILDDSKVKKFYHKATLVVHPDKTRDLPADQRFLSKRIFDALTQAKTEFDEGKR
jgi:hypothetical protein